MKKPQCPTPHPHGERGASVRSNQASPLPLQSGNSTTDPQDELFDVYDAEGQRLGHSKARRLVHQDGDWHLALHIWVGGVDEEGRAFALFQRRSMTKDTWPGALDVAVGGHVRAGETLEETVREADEEIGLRVSLSELVFIGRRFTQAQHSGYIDREIEDVFAVRSDLGLGDYRLHPDEVDAVVAVGLEDARRLFLGEIASVRGISCARDGQRFHLDLVQADFVKVEGSYIEDALAALGRVVRGETVIPFELRAGGP